MLPSPPLTAESFASSPRSLKRSLSNATDDAFTPPLSQPRKRRRHTPSLDIRSGQQDDIEVIAMPAFDPSSLVTPPEYTHVPYDPEFGAKVCRQYRRSLETRRACDAVTLAARRQKYGEKYALMYSPGHTPDEIRHQYEQKQKELDEMAADIIANSDSEVEAPSDYSSINRRKEMRCTRKKLRRRRSKAESEALTPGAKIGMAKARHIVSTTRRSGSHTLRTAQHAVPMLLRSDDYDDFTIGKNAFDLTTTPCQMEAFEYHALQRETRGYDSFHATIS